MAISPTTARRMYEDQLPSFMAVFTLDSEATNATSANGHDGENATTSLSIAKGDIYKHQDNEHKASPSRFDSKIQPRSADMRQFKFGNSHSPAPLISPGVDSQYPMGVVSQQAPWHKSPRDPIQGVKEQHTKYTESSPATTLSSTDSSPASNLSPESPTSTPGILGLVPLNEYSSTSFNNNEPIMNLLTLKPSPNPHSERPMTSPAAPRRPRNMKGLSIQPPFNATNSHGIVENIASPMFLDPLKGSTARLSERLNSRVHIPIKRKPSLLSLKTNTWDLSTRDQPEVPPSPGMPPILQRRALKHSTSSPQMLSGLKSCTYGPTGGMSIPKFLERNESGLSEVLRPIKSGISASCHSPIQEESTIKLQLASRVQLDRDTYAEQEHNEDQRSPGYPDGPIAIYGDSVFLYMEPTAEEASRFDLVINVAREVRNPFHPNCDDLEAHEADGLILKSIPGKSGCVTPCIAPDTATTQATFMTALERQSTPTREPEYIHMPWDHHTNISTDLMKLCDTIDDRARQGKKVLIHCQQGASRSASLIIAYGMYLNPDLSVNDAYYAAQARSKWISPNMKLMYCLQDFQKEVSKKKTPQTTGFRPKANWTPPKHKLTLSAEIPVSPQEPRTAPLPSHMINTSISPLVSECPTPLDCLLGDTFTRARQLAITTSHGRSITPGPSSAPSCFSSPPSDITYDPKWLDSVNVCEQPTKGPSYSVTEFPDHEISCLPSSSALAISRQQDHLGKTNIGIDGINKVMFVLSPTMATTMVSTSDKHTAIAENHTSMVSNEQALMSPRAERMIRKPFSQLADSAVKIQSQHFPLALAASNPLVGEPTGEQTEPALVISPRASVTSKDLFYPFARPVQNEDPRSPVTLGETHIVRSIDEHL